MVYGDENVRFAASVVGHRTILLAGAAALFV